MTKTARDILRYHLKRVYFNGSTDMVARQNGVIPNDTKLGEIQIEVELDQALKELEAIIDKQVIGKPNLNKPLSDYFEHPHDTREKLRTKQRKSLQTALYGKED